LIASHVDERDQFVHLEERPRRPLRADEHAPTTRGVALDVLVLDRLVENRGERLDELF